MSTIQDVDAIDTTIEQVERLYRTVTGKDVPAAGQEPYVPIPPERSPEEHLTEQVDRLVQALQTFRIESTGRVRPWTPPLSVWENANESVITLDLPGVGRESLHLTLSRGVLEVSGERPMLPYADEGFQLRHSEQGRGPFRRLVPLPLAAETGELRARMRDGVLEIRVPKGAGAGGPMDIPIT